MSKEKIFVSAYACEPNMGTEIGVGWHWALEMSKFYELWVLTRKSNQKHIEQWMDASDIKYDIHFVYFDLPKALRVWKKGLRGVRTYYVLWQHLSNRMVKRVMRDHDIHIYHLLTYGNSLWPASSYGMKQFFIWGPTGGVDRIPREYTKYYPGRARLVEFIRRTVVQTLPLNIGFNQRCKNADLIFCKSNSMYWAVPDKYRNNAILFTDVAVEAHPTGTRDVRLDTGIVKYLVVGRLDPWRGFDILIEAFSLAVKENPFIELEIIGEGADGKRLRQLIGTYGLSDQVTMTGKVPIEIYYKKMADCGVVINPCLKEGAVTASFDALSFGKPLIGIETGGYTRYFQPEYSIIIPREGREETIAALSNAILELSDHLRRLKMSQSAYAAGMKYSWAAKGEEIAIEIDHAYRKAKVD